MKSKLLSSCCNAPIKAGCADEGTSCYVCVECKKACDWHEENPDAITGATVKCKTGCVGHMEEFNNGKPCTCNCHQSPLPDLKQESWDRDKLRDKLAEVINALPDIDPYDDESWMVDKCLPKFEKFVQEVIAQNKEEKTGETKRVWYQRGIEEGIAQERERVVGMIDEMEVEEVFMKLGMDGQR